MRLHVSDGVLTHVARAGLLDHWPGAAASLDRAGRVAARLVAWIPRRLKARVFRGATA